MKLFLVCGCSDGTDRTNGLHVLRQLRARGHEVTLFGKFLPYPTELLTILNYVLNCRVIILSYHFNFDNSI